jgi:hypothetical protein
MNRRIIIAALSMTLLGSAAVLAQGAQAPQMPMSFFVAANPTGTGNLGGLEGADRICQTAAAAAGAGNRTWHAYLSQEQRGTTPRVNARGRIGDGPWYNAKGQLIASNVADLHGDQQRDRNNIQRATALDGKGNPIPGPGQPGVQNEHDVMTGSDPQGRAFTDGLDHTCNNWTSDQMTLPVPMAQQAQGVPPERARAMLGHMDRSGGGNISWNSAHMSQGCTKQSLNNTGGAGRIYCFAIN